MEFDDFSSMADYSETYSCQLAAVVIGVDQLQSCSASVCPLDDVTALKTQASSPAHLSTAAFAQAVFSTTNFPVNSSQRPVDEMHPGCAAVNNANSGIQSSGVQNTVSAKNAEIASSFEAMERSFCERFLASATKNASSAKTGQNSAVPIGVVPDSDIFRQLAISSWSPNDQGLRQVVCMLTVLQQLSAVRSKNQQLQRQCELLRDSQALLRAHNRMLLSSAASRTTSAAANSSASSAKSRSQLASRPSRDQHHPRDEVVRRDGDVQQQHRRTVRSSSHAPTGNRMPFTSSSTSSAGYKTPPPMLGYDGDMRRIQLTASGFKLQRSLSAGSFDDVDDRDKNETGVEERPTTTLDSGHATMTSSVKVVSSVSASRRERKKSRKLQEKWEQVKKVFSGTKSQDSSQVISSSVKMSSSTRRSVRSASTSAAGTPQLPQHVPMETASRPVADRKSWVPASSDYGYGSNSRTEETVLGPVQGTALIGESGSMTCGGQSSASTFALEGDDLPHSFTDQHGVDEIAWNSACAAIAAQRRRSSPLLNAVDRQQSTAEQCQRRTENVSMSTSKNLLTTPSTPGVVAKNSTSSSAAASPTIGRSASFKMKRTTDSRLSPKDITTSGSKSLPTTPIERVSSDRDAFHADATESASKGFLRGTSVQRAQAAWDMVKDIIGTRRDESPNPPEIEDNVESSVRRQKSVPGQRQQQVMQRRRSTGSEDGFQMEKDITGCVDDPWVVHHTRRQTAPSWHPRQQAEGSTAAPGFNRVSGHGQSDNRNQLGLSTSDTAGRMSLSPSIVPPDGTSGSGLQPAELAAGKPAARMSTSIIPFGLGGIVSTGSGSSKQRKRFSVSSHHSSSAAAAALSNSPLDLAGLLAAGVSDDFNKKMQEWETKKKRGVARMDTVDCTTPPAATKFSEDFIKKMEEWEQKKLARNSSFVEDLSSAATCQTTMQAAVVADDGSQQRQEVLSESFSKTVQDWEQVRRSRAKYRSEQQQQPASSISGSITGVASAKAADRSKSRDRERDKSRQRAAEKELTKIGRRQQKLEDELKRLVRAKIKLEAQLENSSASVASASSGGRRTTDEIEDLSMDLLEHGYGNSVAVDEGYGVASWNTAVSSGAVEGTDVLQREESRHAAFEASSPHQLGHHFRTKSTKTPPPRGSDTTLLPTIQRQSSFSMPSSSPSTARAQMLPQQQNLPRGSPHDREPAENTSGRLLSTLGGGNTALAAEGTGRRRTSTVDKRPAEAVASTISTEDALRRLQRLVADKQDDIFLLQDEIQQLTDRINAMDAQHQQQLERCRKQLAGYQRLVRASKIDGGSGNETDTDSTKRGIELLRQQLESFLQRGRAMETDLSISSCGMMMDVSGLKIEIERLMQQQQQLQANSNTSKRNTSRIGILLPPLHEYLVQVQLRLTKLHDVIKARNALLEIAWRHLVFHDITNKVLRLELDKQFSCQLRRRMTVKRWKTFSGLDNLNMNTMEDNDAPVLPVTCVDSKLVLDAVRRTMSSDLSGTIPASDSDLLTALLKAVGEAESAATRTSSPVDVRDDGQHRDGTPVVGPDGTFDRDHVTVDAEVQTMLTISECDRSSRTSTGLHQLQPPSQQLQLQQLLLLRQQQQQQVVQGQAVHERTPLQPTASSSVNSTCKLDCGTRLSVAADGTSNTSGFGAVDVVRHHSAHNERGSGGRPEKQDDRHRRKGSAPDFPVTTANSSNQPQPQQQQQMSVAWTPADGSRGQPNPVWTGRWQAPAGMPPHFQQQQQYSAFRPVFATGAPSTVIMRATGKRGAANREPRLPYFEVCDVSADPLVAERRRFFRPISIANPPTAAADAVVKNDYGDEMVGERPPAAAAAAAAAGNEEEIQQTNMPLLESLVFSVNSNVTATADSTSGAAPQAIAVAADQLENCRTTWTSGSADSSFSRLSAASSEGRVSEVWVENRQHVPSALSLSGASMTSHKQLPKTPAASSVEAYDQQELRAVPSKGQMTRHYNDDVMDNVFRSTTTSRTRSTPPLNASSSADQINITPNYSRLAAEGCSVGLMADDECFDDVMFYDSVIGSGVNLIGGSGTALPLYDVSVLRRPSHNPTSHDAGPRSRTKSDSSIVPSIRTEASSMSAATIAALNSSVNGRRASTTAPTSPGRQSIYSRVEDSSTSLLSVEDYNASQALRRSSAGCVPATSSSSSKSIGTATRHYYQTGSARGATETSSLSSSVGGGTGSSRALSLRASPFRQSPSPLIVRKLKSAAELMRESNELQQQRRRRARHHDGGDGTTAHIDRSRPHTSYIPSSASLKCDPENSGQLIDGSTWTVQGGSQPTVAMMMSGTSRSQSFKNVRQAEGELRTVLLAAGDSSSSSSRSKSQPPSQASMTRGGGNSSSGSSSMVEKVHIVCITATPTTLQTDAVTAGAAGGDNDGSTQLMKQSSPELVPVLPGNQMTASSGKTSRSKFLDSTWFQKPKKFFKTSK